MSAPAVAGAASGSPHSVQPGDGESAAVVLSPNTEEEAEALIEGFQDAAVTAPQALVNYALLRQVCHVSGQLREAVGTIQAQGQQLQVLSREVRMMRQQQHDMQQQQHEMQQLLAGMAQSGQQTLALLQGAFSQGLLTQRLPALSAPRAPEQLMLGDVGTPASLWSVLVARRAPESSFTSTACAVRGTAPGVAPAASGMAARPASAAPPARLTLADFGAPVRGAAAASGPTPAAAMASAVTLPALPSPVPIQTLAHNAAHTSFRLAHISAVQSTPVEPAAPAAAAPAADSRHGATARGVSRASAGANAERREHLDPVPENLPLSVEDVYAEYHDKIRPVIELYGNSWNSEKVLRSKIPALRWNKRWPIIKRIFWEARNGGSLASAATAMDKRWREEQERHQGGGSFTLTKFVDFLRGENTMIIDGDFYPDGVTNKGEQGAQPAAGRRARQSDNEEPPAGRRQRQRPS